MFDLNYKFYICPLHMIVHVGVPSNNEDSNYSEWLLLDESAPSVCQEDVYTGVTVRNALPSIRSAYKVSFDALQRGVIL